MDSGKKDLYYSSEPPPLARRRNLASPGNNVPGAPDASRAYRRAEVGAGLRMHPDHRVRLRRRRGEHHPNSTLFNKLMWLALLLIVGVYGLALVYFTLKGRARASAPPPSAAAEPAPVAAPAPRTDLPPIADQIADWKRAQAMVREAGAMNPDAQLPMIEDRLRAALELAPDHLQAREQYARVMERKLQYAAAEEAWRGVLARDPERTEARARLAATLLAARRPEEALVVARWVIEGDPYSESGHQTAAAALTELKQPQDAITHLRRLAGMNRDDLAVQNNLGVAYLGIRDFASALTIFREVLRVDPNNSVAYYNLAVCHAHRNSTEESVEILMQAARKFGYPFVIAWTRSADFDPIRGHELFTQFIEQDDEIAIQADQLPDLLQAEMPSAGAAP